MLVSVYFSKTTSLSRAKLWQNRFFIKEVQRAALHQNLDTYRFNAAVANGDSPMMSECYVLSSYLHIQILWLQLCRGF